jgi:hypothetical protein
MSDKTKIISFNTGRKYSPDGQRIIAEQTSNGVVTFWDIDRSLCKQYTSPLSEMPECQIMRLYDIGGLDDVRETSAMRAEAVRLDWYNSQSNKPSWWGQFAKKQDLESSEPEESTPGMRM